MEDVGDTWNIPNWHDPNGSNWHDSNGQFQKSQHLTHHCMAELLDSGINEPCRWCDGDCLPEACVYGPGTLEPGCIEDPESDCDESDCDESDCDESDCDESEEIRIATADELRLLRNHERLTNLFMSAGVYRMDCVW